MLSGFWDVPRLPARPDGSGWYTPSPREPPGCETAAQIAPVTEMAAPGHRLRPVLPCDSSTLNHTPPVIGRERPAQGSPGRRRACGRSLTQGYRPRQTATAAGGRYAGRVPVVDLPAPGFGEAPGHGPTHMTGAQTVLVDGREMSLSVVDAGR